jgi:hypothetical protein
MGGKTMKRRAIATLSLAAALAATSACSRWKEKDTVSVAVWSDDDASQAYVVQYYEERKINQILETITERRNFEYQVFVQNPNGSGRHALTSRRPGQSGPDLFYMKTQGYIVYGEVQDPPLHVLRRLNLNGSEQTIAESTAMFAPCGAASAVPSPDGATLAVLEHQNVPGGYPPPGPPPPDVLAECQDIIISVTFLDAATLAEQGSWTWEADGFMEYGWTAEDEFFVQTVEGTWRVDPATGPQAAAAPECLNPKTTSSSISAGGVYLQPTMDPDDPIDSFTDPSIPTFGNCSGS